MSYKITQTAEDCIGCGACTSVCDNWELGSDGKAHPRATEVDEIGCNKEAADVCPVGCIHVGKKK
jgi:ferredoxin